MATYTTQSIDTVGTAVTLSAVALTDRFLAAERTFLWVKNGSGASINVTITTPGTIDGLSIADRVVAVPAGADRLIAVPDTFYRSSDGLADVAYSAITTVTAACVRI